MKTDKELVELVLGILANSDKITLEELNRVNIVPSFAESDNLNSHEHCVACALGINHEDAHKPNILKDVNSQIEFMNYALQDRVILAQALDLGLTMMSEKGYDKPYTENDYTCLARLVIALTAKIELNPLLQKVVIEQVNHIASRDANLKIKIFKLNAKQFKDILTDMTSEADDNN